MKSKYFALLLLVICTSFLGLAGCGDIYQNLRVTVSTNVVELYLDRTEFDDTGTEVDLSTITITANVEGLSSEMTPNVHFEYKDNTIAEAQVISVNGSESTIQIRALNAGTTTLRVVSTELSTVYSEDISVTVYKEPESMHFLEQNISVQTGSSLPLITNNLIGFDDRVYPDEATFSLLTPDNELWNSAYGDSILNGVSIENNILTVSQDAECGIVQVEASMANGVHCAFNVLVYSEITSDMIHLYGTERRVPLDDMFGVSDATFRILSPTDVGWNNNYSASTINGATLSVDTSTLILANGVRNGVVQIGVTLADRTFYAYVVVHDKTDSNLVQVMPVSQQTLNLNTIFQNSSFSLIDSSNPMWDGGYGANALSATIQSGILMLNNVQNTGVVQVSVTFADNSQGNMIILVYDDSNSSAIKVQSVGEVTSLKFAINTEEMNTGTYYIVNDDTRNPNYRLRVATSDNSVLVPSTPNDQNRFTLTCFESGMVQVYVYVDIIDPVTQEVYISFSRTFDAEVIRIAQNVILSGPNISASANPINDAILQNYYQNILGEQVDVTVSPEEARDRSYIIKVIAVDGSTENLSQKISGLNIYVNARSYVNDLGTTGNGQYIYGERLLNGTSFYVSVDAENNMITQTVTLAIIANSYDSDLPLVQNTITFTLVAGVQSITPSVDVVEVGLGQTTEFSLSYYTSLGENVGSPTFDEVIGDDSVISFIKTGYTYTVNGLKEGNTTITITAESGVFIEIPVYVYVIPTAFYITSDHSYNNSNIAVDEWNDADYVNPLDNLIDAGVTSLTVKRNNRYNINIVTNPTDISTNSLTITIGSTDSAGEYISLAPLDDNNSFSFYARNVTNTPVIITVTFTYRTYSQGVWATVSSTRNLEINIYNPVTLFYWNGTNNNTNLTVELYDINSLNINQQNLATTTLSIYTNTDATVYQNSSIDWVVDNPELLSITTNGLSATITANLVDYSLSSYTVYVTARVFEYGQESRVARCRVIIRVPEMVESIEVTNYNNVEGVRLNDIGTSQRTSFTINTQVLPNNAFNSDIGFALYEAQNVDGTVVATSLYTGAIEDAVVRFDANQPNRIIAQNAGYAVIRIYPLDRINRENIDLNDIYHVDIWVIVEDGELNPYSIYTAEEFMAIGSSSEALTKNYVLMQSIDISNYANELPIGNEFGSDFSGNIESYNYSSNGNKNSILGINLNNTFVTNETQILGGLFGRVSGNISNIDFVFSERSMFDLANITATNPTINEINLGLLAGVVDGEINNVAVRINNFSSLTSNVLVNGKEDADYEISIGGIAGRLGGTISASYVNVAIRTDLGASVLYLGGLVGVFNGSANTNVIGQSGDSVTSRVRLTAVRDDSIDNDASAVGGLVGLTQAGTIYNQNIMGQVTATNYNNVGGLTGYNNATIGYFADNVEYRVLAGVKTQGNDYVGGLVGYNAGTVNFARAENYEDTTLSGVNQALAYGNRYVGGLIGYSVNGNITYSYSMGYISQEFTALDSGTFNGDVIGKNYVGGLIGYALNSVITNSFASNCVQIDATNEGVGGGLIGQMQIYEGVDLSQSRLQYAYSNGYIITNNADTTKTGELIGVYQVQGVNNNEYVSTCYAHVVITNTIDNQTYRNLIGTNTSGGNVVDTYYLADTTAEIPDRDNITEVGVSDDDMVAGSNGFGNSAYIGWGFGDASGTQVWVAYDSNTMQGVNGDLPLLYDYDRGWLYNQAINNISVTPTTLQQDGDLLPTYFNYNDLGSVVVLENIDLVDGERRIAIHNTSETSTPNGLFDIEVLPLLDPASWSLSVTSSNNLIAEVVQDNLNLIDAYIIFRNTGVVNITFQSLLDVSASFTVTINILGGFSSFDILDDQDSSITLEGANSLSIKQGSGELLVQSFTRQNAYNDSFGIRYTTSDTSYFGFSGYDYSGTSVYVPYGQPNLLAGLVATTDIYPNGLEMIACPYFVLEFAGSKINYSLENYLTPKNFFVSVYYGIIEAGFNSTSAIAESWEQHNLVLNVISDNPENVIISNIQVTRDNVVLDDYSEVLTVKDRVEGAQSVTQNYLLELDDSIKNITSNVTYEISIDVSDESGLYDNYDFTITFTPSPISRIDLAHFTYGTSSMDNGEVASNLISPGTQGVLRVEVTYEFSYFDYLLLNSTTSQNQSIQMQQLVLQNGNYRRIEARYDTNGALIVNKITGYDASGNAYFNGVIFVSTLVGSNLVEGVQFTISAVAMREGESNYVFQPVYTTLITTFAPNATLTLDSINGDAIAKGTVANFHLNGELFNSTLTLSASYGSDQTGIQFSTFDRNIRTSYGVGAREIVSVDLPFYVGIGATPPNGEITVTVTIESTTATGGRLNPLVLQYTIYIVDFAVQSVYTEGAEDGSFNASIRTHTILQANWTLIEPSLTDYQYYVGGSDISQFNQALDEIHAKANAKLSIVNELGDGQGGVWYYNDGNGYSAVQSALTYPDFIISYTTMTEGQSYYLIQGKTLVTGLPFRLSFTGNYVYNVALNIYEFMLNNELNNVAPENILTSYQKLFEQDFSVDIINNTSDDAPDIIDSVEKFRSMTAGVDYMLTTNIVLDNWTPIDTAIASLDGNGYTITIRSFAQNTSDTANYGLFSTLQEGTVLKNLIIDVSYNIFVNLQNASTVNFGFIAGINDGGTIYNCDVVVTQSKEAWRTIYNSPDGNRPTSNNSDFSFATTVFNRILNDADPSYKTLASTFIMTDLSSSSRQVTTYIGGLVGQNNGYITNSRVGRIDTENVLGYDTINRTYALQGLNIFASGNVGGLVGQNTGVISNSYFANGTVVNYSMSIYTSTNRNGSRTGGLVAEQTNVGRIESSYAIGQLGENAQAELGGIIAYGTIGGLVHSNAGSITNSYTNLPLSSSNAMGGFVYENTGSGSIKYSYSMSKINSSGLINGIFVGVDAEGNIQNDETASIENSFYYSNDNIYTDGSDPATAISANEWGNATGTAFEGFAISGNEYSTWYMDMNRLYLGPQLRFADKVYLSHRTTDYTYDASCRRGSDVNPILIASLEDWQNIFNYSDTSGLIRSEFMESNPNYTSGGARYVFGNNRDLYVALGADIDFGSSMHSTATETLFKGKLLGNGYNLSNLSYRQTSTVTTSINDFGVFNSLEDAVVTNLNLVVDGEITTRARHMGVLAGSIADSYIENINISGTTTTTSITGLNMTGALAGFIYGNSEVRNITGSISVNSISATLSSGQYIYYNSAQNAHYADYSYAGGLVGVIDLSYEEDAENNSRVQNLQVSGNTDIYGEIAGGIVGLLSQDSEAKGLNFIVDTSNNYTPRIRGSNFAGGLVGENRGHIISSFVGIPLQEQMTLDSSINSTDNARNYIGYTQLFENTETSTAVGGLVGLNIAGAIEYSYSRVAVYSGQAYIVGGLVGMAINSPDSFASTSSDTTLNYLRNLSLGDSYIYEYEPIDEMFNYSYVGGNIQVAGELKFSATMYQVYTTGAINGGTILGGAVGMIVGAPIYANYTDVLVVAVNNYDSSDNTLISKINSEDAYFGSVVGYVGYSMSGTDSVAPFISGREVSGEYSLGTPAQSIRAVSSIAGNSLDTIGNKQAILSVRATDFITCATSTINDPFADFSDTVWTLDSSRVSQRFPILKANYSATVSEIDSVEDFFNFLTDTNTNSYGRIVTDLTITGNDWYTHILQNGLYSAVEGNDVVSGRLEGAVPIEVSGQSTTRSATITFTNFGTISNTNVAQAFWSLFGYTESFRVINIDFVFDFTIDMTHHTITNFGLLARESNGSSFENISIEFTEGNNTIVNNLDNVSLVTGTSQNCTYTNVVVNGNIETANTNTDGTGGFVSPNNSVSMGALFGSGTVSNTIYGTEFGQIGISYNSGNNYTLNIGGLLGTTSGLLSVRSVSIDEGASLTSNISVTAHRNTANMYVGGVIGRTEGATQLVTFSVDGNITTNRENASNAQSVYLGGVAGSLYNTNVSSVESYIDLNSNMAGGKIYLGGIAGSIVNNQQFTGTNSSMQFSGYVTNGANFTGSITHTADTNTTIYGGGIYGFAQNRLNMSNATVVPVGQPRLVLTAMHSSGDLSIDTATNNLYIGGLIGSATQGRLNNGSYTELTTPNSILRISSSAFTGSINIANHISSDSYTRIGGIVGNSQLSVYDSLSNGTIFVDAENALTVYAGGIVGVTNTDVGYCVSITSIQTHMPTNSNNSSIRAIRGINDNASARVVYSYYSAELSGLLDLFGTNLTALEMLDASSFTNNNTNILSNFTYLTQTDDDGNTTQISFMYPTVIGDYLDLQLGSANVPVFVENLNMLQGQLGDETTPNKVIYFNTSTITIAEIPNIEIANARKIVGNGITISLADLTASGSNVTGIFTEIPRNVVVSGINVEFGATTINANASFDFGGIAGVNNGAIYGSSVIGREAENTANALASDFANLVQNYQNNFTGLRNSATSYIYINITGSNTINFGGLVGVNNGSITGVLSNIDIYTNGGNINLGGIAGDMTNAILSNSISEGRIFVNNSNNNSYVGGFAGSVENSYASASFANSNIAVFNRNTTHIGFAFGEFNGLNIGIVVNSDVSGNINLEQSNNYYNIALTTSEMMSASQINSIINNESNNFVDFIWSIGDNTQNYGYPVLNNIYIDFNTGDGTQSNPYKIREGAELVRLTQSNATGRYFTLIRDVIVSSSTISSTSSGTIQANEFNGNGNIILVNSLYEPTTSSGTIYASLFRQISSRTTVRRLGIVLIESGITSRTAQIYFGGLAGTNSGTISNCAVQGLGEITLNSLPNSRIGGLIGQNGGAIENSWAELDINAFDGYIGGLVGLLGTSTSQDSTSTATIHNSFSMSSINVTQNTTNNNYRNTSVGGLVGLANAEVGNGHSIENCYVYGARINVASAGSYVGGLIGNALKFNTYRTYAFVFTPSSQDTNYSGAGNYENMGMIGNTLEGAFDATSWLAVWLGPYTNDPTRLEPTDACAVISITELRTTAIGAGCYSDWITSAWSRNRGGAEMNAYTLYLTDVTPIDKQERVGASIVSEDIFDY